MIRARGIHKSYWSGKSELQVLRGVDLDVADGEFVGDCGRKMRQTFVYPPAPYGIAIVFHDAHAIKRNIGFFRRTDFIAAERARGAVFLQRVF